MCSLGKTLLAFSLLHSVFQVQICLVPQVFLDFLLLHFSPLQGCCPLQGPCLLGTVGSCVSPVCVCRKAFTRFPGGVQGIGGLEDARRAPWPRFRLRAATGCPGVRRWLQGPATTRASHLATPSRQAWSPLGSGRCSWTWHSPGRIQLAFALLQFVVQGQTCLLLQVSLDFLPLHFNPL